VFLLRTILPPHSLHFQPALLSPRSPSNPIKITAFWGALIATIKSHPEYTTKRERERGTILFTYICACAHSRQHCLGGRKEGPYPSPLPATTTTTTVNINNNLEKTRGCGGVSCVLRGCVSSGEGAGDEVVLSLFCVAPNVPSPLA